MRRLPGRRLRHVLVTVLFAVCAGCSGTAATLNGSGVPDADSRRRTAVRVERVLWTAPDTLFGTVSGMDVDGEGRLYVGDWLRHRVVVLSPAGEVVTTLGRRGRGPGEFRTLRGVQWIGGDTLLVHDPAQARAMLFDVDDGEPLRTIRFDLPVHRIWRRTDGSFFGLLRPVTRVSDDGGVFTGRDVIVRLDADGSSTGDSLVSLPPRSQLVALHAGATFLTPHPFAADNLFAFGRDGRLHYVRTDSARVHSVSRDGSAGTLPIVEHVAPPVEEADVEAWLSGLTAADRRVYEPVLRGALPDRWPSIRGIVTDERGRLWVGLAAPAGSPVEWMVLARDGSYVRSVLLPFDVQPWAVVAGRVYGTRQDELGLNHVTALQVPGV